MLPDGEHISRDMASMRPTVNGSSRQHHQRQQRQQDVLPSSHSGDETENDNIQAYIPPYLRQYVVPYRGDFCLSRIFDARLISALMAEGFLPIATEGFLLPKLHQQRCLVRLDQNDLHISKSTRKKAKRYALSVNRSFREVVKACRQQHGETCWLYDPLVSAFQTIHESADNAATVYNQPTRRAELCPVKLYSIEAWNKQGKLVAGELGYTVGSIYTSLTGFCVEDGAGSAQLAALGSMLHINGFAVWDLGMDMEYKRGLGATLMKRAAFVRLVHRVRHQFGNIKLPVDNRLFDYRALIDQAKA